MASTFSGRVRPRVSKRRNISFLPSPASIRRVVHPDSSNVELPVLPEARMDTRNEIRFPRESRQQPQTDARDTAMGWWQSGALPSIRSRARETRLRAYHGNG